MELFASVDDENVDGVSSYFSIPSSKVDEFQINYQNSTQRMEAYFDCYVHNHPVPSWGRVALALRFCGLQQQADMVKNTYIQGIFNLLRH